MVLLHAVSAASCHCYMLLLLHAVVAVNEYFQVLVSLHAVIVVCCTHWLLRTVVATCCSCNQLMLEAVGAGLVYCGCCKLLLLRAAVAAFDRFCKQLLLHAVGCVYMVLLHAVSAASCHCYMLLLLHAVVAVNEYFQVLVSLHAVIVVCCTHWLLRTVVATCCSCNQLMLEAVGAGLVYCGCCKLLLLRAAVAVGAG